MHRTLDFCPGQTSQKRIKCAKAKEQLSSYCPYIYCDLYQDLKTNWTDFAAKKFLGQYFQGEEPLSKKLEDKVDAIAEFYFKNGIEFESQEGFKNLTDAFGDSGFLYGTHLMAEYDFLFFDILKHNQQKDGESRKTTTA